MKKQLMKFLIFTLFIFSFFILPNVSSATTLISQTDDSGQINTDPNFVANKLINLGTGLTGRPKQVVVSMSTYTTYSTRTIKAQIFCYDSSAYTTHAGCTPSTGYLGDSQTIVTIPANTAKTHYTFDFTNISYNLDPTKYYQINVTPTGSGNYPTFFWGNAALTSLYFVFDNTDIPAPTNMTIDSPVGGSFLSTATSTVISGKCMTASANQLELTTSPFLARLDDASKFNITCTSNYTYSTTFKPLVGSNTVWVVDKSVIGENPPDIFNNQRYANAQYTGYTGSASGLSWFLSIEYPADNGSHSFTINPNTTQQFRFRFKVPDDSLKAQGRTKTTLWTSNSRLTASTSYEFLDLNNSDLDGDGLLGLNVGPVPDGQTWYYTEYLENGTTTMYSIPFSVTASSSAQSSGTTINPNAPDDRQYGPCLNLPLIGLNNFCFGTMFYALVIPNPRFYKDDVNDTYTLMQTKIPFAFYYQLKGQLSGVTASSTDFTYNIPVTLASGTGVSLVIPFSSNNSGVHSVRSTLDPWFKAFAWFYFAWWAYRKSINFRF
jgi:hypothetical protein